MIKYSYWRYCEIKQFYLLRNYFAFQNNGEPLDLEKIEIKSIQKVYLMKIMIKQNKMTKFRTDNEYAFVTETIFSSIPQAFLQAGIFHENLSKYVDFKQLVVHLVRIFLAIYSVSEGSSSFIDYFPPFLFDIEITSSLFYVLRIITNILFFSSRLMCIVIAFHYHSMAVILVILAHFIIYFILNFFYSLSSENSSLVNFFLSFYIVSLKMTTFFEESSFDLFYIFHNLISWLENIFLAFSFYHQVGFLEKNLIFFSVFSFLFGLALEFVFVKKFIKKCDEKNYSNSIINDSFRKTKLLFNSIYL